MVLFATIEIHTAHSAISQQPLWYFMPPLSPNTQTQQHTPKRHRLVWFDKRTNDVCGLVHSQKEVRHTQHHIAEQNRTEQNTNSSALNGKQEKTARYRSSFLSYLPPFFLGLRTGGFWKLTRGPLLLTPASRVVSGSLIADGLLGACPR